MPPKYRRKDHPALTTTCLQSFAFGVFFFDSEVISLSKYEPLWRFLSGDGSGCIQFSFERIEEILGFSLDHSFLRYKQEAEQYGYRVEKISLKEKWVRFVRIAAQRHHTFANPLAFLYNIGEERQGTHMKKNYESVYRMKLTGYQVRTAIGILNERRLALKSQGCTLENSEEYVGVFNLLSRFLDLLPA